MFKRIIPFILIFSIILSSLAFSASAEDISSQTTTFWNMLVHSVWNTANQADVPFITPIAKGISSWFSGDVCSVSDDGWHHAESAASSFGGKVNCLCRYCSETFVVGADALADAYDNYVTDLEMDLGTSILTDSGLVYYGRFVQADGSTPTAWTFARTDTSKLSNGAYWYSQPSVHTETAPIEGYYTFFTDLSGTNVDISGFDARLYNDYMSAVGDNQQLTRFNNTYLAAGATLNGYGADKNQNYVRYFKVCTAPTGNFSHYSFVLRYGWKIVPVSGSIPTSHDITINSRPSSFVGPVGVRNEDNSYTVYNQIIVNETDNTIFNPVTNITTVFTDWAFDYSTRTYTLTLEDGSIVTVIYGDDCMTIIQGDQEYTVYYVIPSEEDPGADPDDPSTDDGSGWAWLKGAWTEMMDKLSGILEAITNLELSPEINVDVDVDVEGEEPVTQESWFSDVLAKFAFLTSVHDIYTQLVADVTSDAATAAAVADGEVMLADVTSGHAAIDGRASYTAPELAISFGSSDKYGVDWAGIRPLNLSWYAPHKETVDGILSGILWLSYLFLLIKRAPGIIRGAEMVTEDRINIYDWHMKNDP